MEDQVKFMEEVFKGIEGGRFRSKDDDQDDDDDGSDGSVTTEDSD